jgi:E-phenylitaconyl-CoA hydratase
MEMLLTGDSFDAATAQRWGLVNKVVSAEEVLPLARQYATKIAKNAPLAVQATKELAIRARSMDLVTGLRFEQMTTRMLQFSADAKEGASAFGEKREPKFSGR